MKIDIKQDNLKKFNKVKVGDVLYGLCVAMKNGRPMNIKLSKVILVESIKKINSFAYYEFIGKDIHTNRNNVSIYGNRDTAIRISKDGDNELIAIADERCLDDILDQIKDMIMKEYTKKVESQEKTIKEYKKMIKGNE